MHAHGQLENQPTTQFRRAFLVTYSISVTFLIVGRLSRIELLNKTCFSGCLVFFACLFLSTVVIYFAPMASLSLLYQDNKMIHIW